MNPNEVLGGLRVLFVDESRDERELFTVIFEGYGALVTTASSGAEALEAFERSRPDLVISDLALPDRDGCALIEEIRGLPACSGVGIPAIALGSWSRDPEPARALEAGFGCQLRKPLDYDDLLCAIAEQCAAVAGSRHVPASPFAPEPRPEPSPVKNAEAAAPVASAGAAASGQSSRTPGNSVLEALPAAELDAVMEKTTAVRLDPDQTLVNIGETIPNIFFPVRSVVSLLSMVESGKTVEVCSVGRHSLVGLSALAGPCASAHWARVLVGGEALRIRSADLRDIARRLPRVDEVLREATCARFVELSQAAICNRVHTIDRQLAKWLLLVSERAQTSTLRVTHDGIAQRFGTRRSSISLALEEFQRKGLISSSRGRVRVLDAAGLRTVACECLEAIEAARVLPQRAEGLGASNGHEPR